MPSAYMFMSVNVTVTFSLAVVGVNHRQPPETYDPVELTIPPGTSGNAKVSKVSFTVPELAKSNQDYFTVTAVSSRSNATAKVTVEVDIIQNYSVILEEVPESAPSFNAGVISHGVQVKNLGNGYDFFRFVIANSEQLKDFGWEAKIVLDEDIGGELDQDTELINLRIGARETRTVPFTPGPRACQDEPSQRAMRSPLGFPPALVKSPPT